jgi:hypothetical protein
MCSKFVQIKEVNTVYAMSLPSLEQLFLTCYIMITELIVRIIIKLIMLIQNMLIKMVAVHVVML